MPYVDANGVHMYYEEEGDGAPLVLLHGGAGAIDADSGWGRLRALFARHYRVLLIEHRGHGRTDNPADTITYPLIADDVAAFIERLVPTPVHLAGMSDGGIAALHLGMQRPGLVRTLVGVGVNYTVDEHIREMLQIVTPEWIERENPAWHADLVRHHDTHKGPGSWRTLVRQVVSNARENPSYSDDDLRRIAVPVLLIAGENDPFGNLEQMVAMKRTIPHAEILIVNNAGHTVQDTHPAIVGPAMLDFLARHD